jgi:integration host factor subunit beta
MTKSDLIEALAENQSHLALRDVELAVKGLLESMSNSLSSGDRIEIRGFGSFSLHFRPPRMGRNPKSGDAVALSGKYVPHFKPGKELRERVNNGFVASLNNSETQANAQGDDSSNDSAALDGKKTGTND